ncbi:MAG: twitching motility protein PilT [candidate division SR1 bacterium CG_4_9_14_3_um_filter_40_9]|nr:MAG: twitching motility protein PilT [candidate division SR1 bacterium CG_4_9_14_3_um_filter_40_9]
MATSFDIEQILALIEKNVNISDLHLSGGESIAYRLNGEIIREEKAGKLTNEIVEVILRQLFQGNPQRFDKFLGDKEADFAYQSKTGTPYRVNAFLTIGKIGIAMRKINGTAKNVEDFMFTDIAESVKKNILGAKKGLYLVTGPTGSGKSTSLVAMLEYINQTRSEHMITIEDPIEFLFQPKKCLISQREIGHDTWSFANALRAAMREDPNIIFVGEIRDRETADSALSLAETGHLVFSTLHTNSAANTVNRLISFFPPEIQESVCDRLATSLIGVQSQFLVKSKDGKSRVGVYEVMLNTTSVRNNIKKREIEQIDNIIETSSLIGMINLKKYAQRLIDKGIIDQGEVQRLFIGQGSF